ncbi:pilus assembly PilX N-terminal domain-containing protein [Clostridium intestinale]|uniref:pilus assembly PilX N-terminal domain-containing protein n=1 Tax=Clostridium intestinale TaxID=36845 RepID=UPI002DD696C6|nr:pilus assembly PilX N-terminal domain-containing protein [Clostridium intestinale]WRY49997.1 pilus assembly PilX N-terminal domain-containing protein [Clostridium intestinale]
MKKSNKKKGASLIIVLMVLAIAMILSSVTLTTISRTAKANASEKKSEDLLYSAESGLQYGLAYVNDKKNNPDLIELNTNILLADKSNINNNEVSVMISKISSGYEIISEATSKLGKKRAVSIKIDEKKISTPVGDGTIKLNSPVALIIPSSDKIFYKEGNATLTPILNSVPPRFNLEKVLNYKNDSKVYKLYKKDNNRGGKIDVTEIGKETAMDFEFKQNSLTPFQYIPELLVTPKATINSDITINSQNIKDYIDINTKNIKIVSLKKVTLNADYLGAINLDNAEIYADEILINGYQNKTINNSKIVANAVYLKDSGQINFRNSQIITKKIETNDSNIRSFDNTKIFSETVNIYGSNERVFKNGTYVKAKNFTIDARNAVSFNLVNVQAENFEIKGSESRTFENSEITVNNLTLSVTNGTKFTNSNIKSGIINLSGSCDNMFGGSTIEANQFLITTGNDVNFDNTILFLNKLDIQGSSSRTFNNSIIVSNIINAYTSNNVNFTASLTICENISFNTSNDINFIAMDGTTEEKINAFNNKFKKAQEQLIIKGTTTKDTYEFQIDNNSLDYSSS